ncbi:hypothetical protein MVES1_001009 [Malassezia vespertilionis]|uniref:Uncharacterized protein n=1 Tax=Malassezia vespertilionis TaxID=2020962 RepID=A0A2N1JDR5_9BASI|nr:uncharacterized protein MVES1_001009 [Malassezia vespertilionis]PKI84689.1 hypothetical protein MVES_000946 [Malassezia vespertilionis]WFD05677.1 hypothetical protein MVES1_001009 [Malassezia vespertilionis]
MADVDPAAGDAFTGTEPHLKGEVKILGSRFWHSLIVSFGHFGGHFVWSILNARTALFLYRLGVSKSVSSFVMMGGPASGLIVQPCVGVISDGCTSRWGRRRPFLFAGMVCCVAALCILAIASTYAKEENSPSLLVTLIGILALIFIDITINAMSAAHRAITLDVIPANDQGTVNAWATRFGNFGSVCGYLFGEIDLARRLPFLVKNLGLDQLGVLCLFGAFFLILSHISLFVCISESVLIQSQLDERQRNVTLVAFLKHLYKVAKRLPDSIRHLFVIQFFSWFAWFPMLYYSAPWVAEIYQAAMEAPEKQHGPYQISDKARNKGSFAMFLYACTAMACSIILPWLISDSRRHLQKDGLGDYAPASTVFALQDPPDTASEPQELHQDTPERTRRFLPRLFTICLHMPTIPEMWFASQILFFACFLLFTCPIFNAHSVVGAFMLIGVLGFSWAMTLWAPFALLGAMLNESGRVHIPLSGTTENISMAPLDCNAEPVSIEAGAHIVPPARKKGLSIQAGTIMGLHNWSIVFPQLAASLLSSLVFWLPTRIWDKATAQAYDSTGLLFRLVSLSTLLAAYCTWLWIQRYDAHSGSTMQR